jgi:hypothetical protein
MTCRPSAAVAHAETIATATITGTLDRTNAPGRRSQHSSAGRTPHTITRTYPPTARRGQQAPPRT